MSGFLSGIPALATLLTTWVDGTHGDDATGTRERMDLSFKTIQAAVNASLNGTVVKVRPGVYPERLDLSGKEVIVEGEDMKKCVLDDDGLSNGTVVRIGANAGLRNFTIDFDSATPGRVMTIVDAATGSPTKWELSNVLIDIATSQSLTVTGLDCSGGNAGLEVVNGRNISFGVGTSGAGSISGSLLRHAAAGLNVLEGLRMQCAGSVTNLQMIDVDAGTLDLDGITWEAGAAAQQLLNIGGGTLYVRNPRWDGTHGTWVRTGGTVVWDPRAPVYTFFEGAAPSGANRFNPIGASRAADAGGSARQRITAQCLVSQMSLQAAVGPGGAVTDTYTLRKDGVDIALSVSHTGATVGVAPGQTIVALTGGGVDLKQTGGVGSVAQDVGITFEMLFFSKD
jgi:hypothetical protein